MNECCENCKYSGLHIFDYGTLVCKRRAPSVSQERRQFAEVDDNEWCGEWEICDESESEAAEEHIEAIPCQGSCDDEKVSSSTAAFIASCLRNTFPGMSVYCASDRKSINLAEIPAIDRAIHFLTDCLGEFTISVKRG